VFLKSRDSEDVAQYITSSDAGGNFVYQHGENTESNRLQSANVFSILEPLAQGSAYQFWLTAVRDNVETDPTQPFDVVVGQESGVVGTVVIIGSALVILLLVIAVVLLSVRHYFLSRRRLTPAAAMSYTPLPHEERALKDIRKDIDSLAYDVEKYSGAEHDRQLQRGLPHDERGREQ
jgi:hypothetical protein